MSLYEEPKRSAACISPLTVFRFPLTLIMKRHFGPKGEGCNPHNEIQVMTFIVPRYLPTAQGRKRYISLKEWLARPSRTTTDINFS